MATEKKLKDPAEAALSAIEQALNLDIPAPGETARVEPRLPDVGDGDPLADPFSEAGGRRTPTLDIDPAPSDLPPPERGRSRGCPSTRCPTSPTTRSRSTPSPRR